MKIGPDVLGTIENEYESAITPNFVHYKIVKLTLRYEYHITLILHKT
jgi:hypothetical protein